MFDGQIDKMGMYIFHRGNKQIHILKRDLAATISSVIVTLVAMASLRAFTNVQLNVCVSVLFQQSFGNGQSLCDDKMRLRLKLPCGDNFRCRIVFLI